MISIDRAKKILACYGGNPSVWPENERVAVQMLLADSKVLSELQQQEFVIDKLMQISADIEQELAGKLLDRLCAERIMNQLPVQEQVISQVPLEVVDKNDNSSGLWIGTFRPLLLAASIVMLVIGLLSNFQFNNTEDSELLTLAEYMAIYVDDSFSTNNELNDDADELEVLAFLEPQLLED